jgi:hypothetical protein
LIFLPSAPPPPGLEKSVKIIILKSIQNKVLKITYVGVDWNVNKGEGWGGGTPDWGAIELLAWNVKGVEDGAAPDVFPNANVEDDGAGELAPKLKLGVKLNCGAGANPIDGIEGAGFCL